MLDAHDVRLLDLALAGAGLHLDAIVALGAGLLAKLVDGPQAAVDDGLGLQVVAAPKDGRVAVQQLLLVELGGVADTGDLLAELVDLKLDVAAVLAGQGVVGRLDGQLAHTLEDGMGLVEGALGGLDHGDAVLGVGHGAVHAVDLGAHLFADGETGRVVGGADLYGSTLRRVRNGSERGGLLSIKSSRRLLLRAISVHQGKFGHDRLILSRHPGILRLVGGGIAVSAGGSAIGLVGHGGFVGGLERIRDRI